MTVEVVLRRGDEQDVVLHPRPLPVGGVVETGEELWRVLAKEASERADVAARYVCAPLGEVGRGAGDGRLTWHAATRGAARGILPGVPFN